MSQTLSETGLLFIIGGALLGVILVAIAAIQSGKSLVETVILLVKQVVHDQPLTQTLEKEADKLPPDLRRKLLGVADWLNPGTSTTFGDLPQEVRQWWIELFDSIPLAEKAKLKSVSPTGEKIVQENIPPLAAS
jgi:hypothetical protein